MTLPDPIGERKKYVEGEHTLRADFELAPESAYSCPIAEIDADVDEIRFNAMDGECRVDLVLTDGRVVRATDELQEKMCFCAVFQDLDCVPHYHGISDDKIEVSAYLTERTEVRRLISELKGLSETIRLVRLTAIGDETGDRTRLLDLSVLTEKQREALELAVGEGYYEGEDTDLDTMATELDISAAALSRRLRRAQANLATELVE